VDGRVGLAVLVNLIDSPGGWCGGWGDILALVKGGGVWLAPWTSQRRHWSCGLLQWVVSQPTSSCTVTESTPLLLPACRSRRLLV